MGSANDEVDGARAGAGPHVVAVPCPLHGHTAPFMQLCELLAQQGVKVTFVSTPRFQPATTTTGLPIHVTLLEDGLPLGYRVSVSDLSTYLRHVELLHRPFHALVEEMLADSACPPITCLLSDSHLGWVQDVANAFALPRICFLTSSTTEFSVLFHQPLLLAQGVLPFKDDDIEDMIRCVPGVPPTKRSEFPSFLQVQDPSDFEFQYFMRQIARVGEADRLLVASFHDLEAQVLQILATKLNIQPIGPLLLQGFHNDREVDTCEKWLDDQLPKSIIYIAFGSLANLEEHEVHAIACGLELTHCSFLWALREDTVLGVPNPLPPCFKDTSNGLVVTWTQQRRILKHPSIGAFLTHCGWGSTLEAICMGVPLLCWPLYGDQLLNCNLVVEQWQVGVKIAPGLANRRKSITPNHVATAINTISSSSIYRDNMTNLQALAQQACGPNGSSQRNFLKLVNDLKTFFAGSS